MLSEGQLDAIHVLLPPDLHAQAAEEIIDARMHVLLEKPMAIAAEACEAPIARGRSAGVKVGVGHNFLFAPIYERLKEDLASGRLGRPDAITITWNKGLGMLQSGPFNLWMLREPGNILLEVGSHSVAHMLDLVGPAEVLGVQATNPLDLPSGSRFFRQWRVEAGPGSVGVSLSFSFAPGFSEHTIHVRGSLASATVDFERNTYLLHHHTPTGMDFDRYHMTVSEAKALNRQARRTLGQVIHLKVRPIGGGPYGQSIARALQSFYKNPGDAVDARLSPELGRDVVRTCVEIGRMMTGTETAQPTPGANGKPHEANGTALGPPPPESSARPEILVLARPDSSVRSWPGNSWRGTSDPGAGPQPQPAARRPERPSGRHRRGRPVSGLRSRSGARGIRCVYHLARSHVKTWEDFAEHEIEATRRVAEACLTAKVGRLIYTGTIDSYYGVPRPGRSPRRHPWIRTSAGGITTHAPRPSRSKP